MLPAKFYLQQHSYPSALPYQLLQRPADPRFAAAHYFFVDLSQRDSNTSPEHALHIVAIIKAGADNAKLINKSSAA
jgi:hypothetical protein